MTDGLIDVYILLKNKLRFKITGVESNKLRSLKGSSSKH